MTASSNPRIGVIFNPYAQRNRKNRNNLRMLKELVGDDGYVAMTRDVETIREVVQKFHELGVRTLVADGGDGALHWVLNYTVQTVGLDETLETYRFMPSGGGTVDFLAKALAIEGSSPADRIQRLIEAQRGTRSARIEAVPSMAATYRFAGAAEGRTHYTYASAIAGYAANFYGPYYRSYRFQGPVRIAGLIGIALGTLGTRTLLQGPLERLKPRALRQAEYDFARHFHGRVLLDGAPFCDAAGREIEEFNLLQCSPVRVNLGGVLKVFGEADDEHFHAHVGYISPVEAPGTVASAILGRGVGGPSAYDGRASSLEVHPRAGDTIIPCLDGELFPNVAEMQVHTGPKFRFVVPATD